MADAVGIAVDELDRLLVKDRAQAPPPSARQERLGGGSSGGGGASGSF
ncbi:MAG: hypothetical protein SFX73_13820 [Kofleriaceae bacterium]|nr:hypothetical protein [Kofleriaceae bacterium]